MLKLPDQDPLPVNSLAKALGKNVLTIYRWGSPRGVRGHRLPLIRIGGRTYVERVAWEAFFGALNHGSIIAAAAAEKGMPSDRIDAELDAAGI